MVTPFVVRAITLAGGATLPANAFSLVTRFKKLSKLISKRKTFCSIRTRNSVEMEPFLFLFEFVAVTRDALGGFFLWLSSKGVHMILCSACTTRIDRSSLHPVSWGGRVATKNRTPFLARVLAFLI